MRKEKAELENPLILAYRVFETGWIVHSTNPGPADAAWCRVGRGRQTVRTGVWVAGWCGCELLGPAASWLRPAARLMLAVVSR